MKISASELPSVPHHMVATADELREVCGHLRAAGGFVFDTEFIGERSYQPQLCLVQVATTERVELLDPFQLADLTPLWELMADERIEKICHAGEQDLEIVWQKSGQQVRNVKDVQIAAGLVGLGYPLAYWRLVEEFTGVTLAKAHTYSAWDARPLSSDQLGYAVDDVRYLPRVWEKLRARINELDRMGWLTAASAELARQSATAVDAAGLFFRVKSWQTLSSPQLAVLRAVTHWREQVAYEHDLPARVMIRDEVLLELAHRGPTTVAALERIHGVPPAELETYGAELTALIAAALALPEDQWPTTRRSPEETLESKRLTDVLSSAAQVICFGQSVTPALVTSQSAMSSLAHCLIEGGDPEQHPLLSGWHAECLGRPLLAFFREETSLQLEMKQRAMQLKTRSLK